MNVLETKAHTLIRGHAKTSQPQAGWIFATGGKPILMVRE